MKKASDEQIISLYTEHKSIYKVANLLGMCPQSIHERLKKLNINTQKNVWKSFEIELIIKLYKKGFEKADGQLLELCKKIGRTKQMISRKAKDLGLSSYNRTVDASFSLKQGIKHKEWHTKNIHPRGMLGKTHSPEYCQVRREIMKAISKKEHRRRSLVRMKSNLEKYGQTFFPQENPKTSWKQAWREVGGIKIYFRSAWEANYGRYLQWLKENGHIIEWLHEPQTFWFEKIKRGSVTYLPDFKVIFPDGHHEWHEVKGWMDARSKTKIRRFKKYFPHEKFKLIDAKWYKENTAKLKIIIKDWE